MQIFVRMMGGKTITLEVTGTTTLRALKRRIKDKTKTSMGFMRLIHSGKQLDGEWTLLGKLGIGRETTIDCVGRMVFGQIFVEFADGTDEGFRWDDSFAKLREEIYERHGIPVERQLLTCNGKTIDDTDPYEIHCTSPNTLGIHVQLTDTGLNLG